MGREKGLLVVEGMTLVERMAEALRSVVLKTVLVGGDPETYARFGLPVIPDLYTGSSLGGIYTAVAATEADYVLVAPCDIPFPNPALFHLLASLRHGYDAVVPRTAGGYEPVCGIYGKNCLAPMLRLLESGNFRIYDFYPEVRIRYVDEVELRRADPSGKGLVNVNTPEEFRSLTEGR
jgi:molybdopterin-guanine dinucleotide biosynthesis protein A